MVNENEINNFEAIINTYKLRIKEFNKNLNDIIKIHNDKNENDLIDDFKIERVHTSNEKLQESLMEYKSLKSLKSKIVEKNNFKNIPQQLKSSGHFKEHLCCLNLYNSISLIESNESYNQNINLYYKSIDNLNSLGATKINKGFVSNSMQLKNLRASLSKKFNMINNCNKSVSLENDTDVCGEKYFNVKKICVNELNKSNRAYCLNNDNPIITNEFMYIYYYNYYYSQFYKYYLYNSIEKPL